MISKALLKDAQMIVVKGKPGLRFGPLRVLTQVALMARPELQRPIHNERLKELFRRDVPGAVETVRVAHAEIHRVNWKAFRKWAQRNARRFFTTVREDREYQARVARANEDFEYELDLDIREELDALEESERM